MTAVYKDMKSMWASMTIHGHALFCLVYLLATASPGPGIAAILARVLARGNDGLFAFIAGFVAGDLIWLTCTATGMAALAQTAHSVFVVVKFAGAAYLLYLAHRLWTSAPQPLGEGNVPSVRQRPSQLFFGSLALTIGNPKVMVFFLALLPTVLDLRKITVGDFLKVALASMIILSGVLSTYAFAALRARRLFRHPRALRWLNRGTGTAMAGAAVAVASQ
ncbi:MAG TPA: LysE family translocator [Xanthobacteraceae bacterium]|nr:LysE family translocator [Xanthobacteraceae bacterium]